MTDYEIIQGLINRDNLVTKDFFFIKCRPLFQSVISYVFSYPVDYDEFVDELYEELMRNDAHKLRKFKYESSVFQWLKVVSIRFFIRKRENMIENSSKELFYNSSEDENSGIVSESTAAMDLECLFSMMKNKRYVYVIRRLMIDNIEPATLAHSMNITTANLYNLKRRAMFDLSQVAIKEKEIYVKR